MCLVPKIYKKKQMNKQINKRYLNQYHEYIANTAQNKWNDNVKEYLQGHDPELYGTILGFKRGWRKDNSLNDHYSFFLFFDHSTARVERYLVNLGVKNDIEVVTVNEDRPPEEHLDLWDDEEKKIVRPIYKSPYNIPNIFMIHNLHDGKLNKNFFSLFTLELFRDYLTGGLSYTNPNISNILKYTYPTDNTGKGDNIRTGSGDLSHYHPSHRELTTQHDLYSFKRKEILDFKGKVRKIMIPKTFNSKEINNLIKNYKFKLEVFNSNDQPLVIRDIKTIMNSRVYTKIVNIDKGIVNLNHTLAKKIHDINNNIKRPNKDKLPIDDQLFLHQMMRKI